MFYHPFDMPFPPESGKEMRERVIEKQYEIPHRLDSLARIYPQVTWSSAQELYAEAVQEVIQENGEKDLLSGKLNFGRGYSLAREKFIKKLNKMYPNDGKGRFYF